MRRVGIALLAFVVVYLAGASLLGNTNEYKRETAAGKKAVVGGWRFISLLLALAAGMLL